MNLRETIGQYAALGLRPIPLRRDGKPNDKWKTPDTTRLLPQRVPGKEKPVYWEPYQKRAPTEKEYDRWFDVDKPDPNIGHVIPPGKIVVDLDGDDHAGAKKAEGMLNALGVFLPEDAPRIKTGKGYQIPMTAPVGTPHIPGGKFVYSIDSEGHPCKPFVEILSVGHYGILPPSIHPNGQKYEWVIEPGDSLPPAPQALLDLIAAKQKGSATRTAAQPAGTGPKWVAAALAGVAAGSRNATCAQLAGYWLKKNVPADIVKEQLRSWALRCTPPLPPIEVDKVVDSVTLTRQNRAMSGQLMPTVMGEDALASEFTRKHGADLLYVAEWGQWMRWNGHLWKAEKTYLAFDLARQVCRTAAARGGMARDTSRLASAATVAAVERLARADRAQAATIEEWDANPWLLNTPGGAVDLRTGKPRAHDREDRMTKIVTAFPEGDCPTWRRFLAEVTAGDEELQAYLARVCGYALTGVTAEHALFFLYGTGANGKSVFLNTLGAVLGDYAKTASADTFLESKTEHHPTAEAALMGARMVIASEVDQGRRWAEAKIKSLTGGDKIAARFMRQDFFEYTPQFKLLIAGNHKPALRDVDEAMRRRMHLIPFTVTIPAEKRDHALTEKLLKERDGIIRWAVEGCLEWQRDGLKPPKAVAAATDEYFQAEDGLGRWLEEACFLDDRTASLTSALFASYKAWAEAAGEFVGSEKRFSQDLLARDLEKWRQPQTGKRGFKGISLRDVEASEAGM